MAKRKNINMSDEIAKWYEDKATELGVTQTALMTIALKNYIDQEKALDMMGKFEKMINDVRKIQNGHAE